MPVYKFKSFEEAEKALWNNKVNKVYLNELKEFYRLKKLLKRDIEIVQGIRKFLTFEEADKAKFEELFSQHN